MHQPDLVRRVQRLGHLRDDLHRPSRAASGPSANTSCRSRPSIEPHVDIEPAVDFAVVVDRDDMRVVQPRRRIRLPAKPRTNEGLEPNEQAVVSLPQPGRWSLS